MEVLNKSLDFSKSGLTQEAAIAVAIIVTIASHWHGERMGRSNCQQLRRRCGCCGDCRHHSGFHRRGQRSDQQQGRHRRDPERAGQQGELKGLLLTMATAGLTQGILGNIKVDGGTTLANVNAQFQHRVAVGYRRSKA